MPSPEEAFEKNAERLRQATNRKEEKMAAQQQMKLRQEMDVKKRKAK